MASSFLENFDTMQSPPTATPPTATATTATTSTVGSDRPKNDGSNSGSSSSSDANQPATATATAALHALHDDAIRRANFSGAIPVRLTLGQTSLSSAIAPQPLHVLVSRQTYLHLGLEDAVRKLYRYAPRTPALLSASASASKSKSKSNTTHHHRRRIVVQEDDDDDDGEEEEEQHGTTTSRGNEHKEKDKDKHEPATPPSSQDSGSDANTTTEKNRSEHGTDPAAEPREQPQTPQPYPVCWFEDVVTEQPLRWQYFAGVLFDSLHPPPPSTTTTTTTTTRSRQLPWELRLHFQSYPSQKLLELVGANHGHGQTDGVVETVRQTFKNSLKQGLVIQHGNSKAALNLSKQSHTVIWDEGIRKGNYKAIKPILFPEQQHQRGHGNQNKHNNNKHKSGAGTNDNNNNNNNNNNDGTEQAESERSSGSTSTSTSKDERNDGEDGNNAGTSKAASNNNNNNNALAMIPVRLSLDPTRPMIQHRINGGQGASTTTLGSLLCEWAPHCFQEESSSSSSVAAASENQNDKNGTNETENHKIRRPDGAIPAVERRAIKSGVYWRIGGITPPLSTPLMDLWRTLRHPDQFLYISILVADDKAGSSSSSTKQ